MTELVYNPRFWETGGNLVAGMSWFLPLIVGFLLSWHYNREQRKLLSFVGFSLIMEYVSSHPATVHLFAENTNSPWYHLGTPILFWLVWRIFQDYLSRLLPTWLLYGIPLLVLLFAVWNAVWGNGFSQLPVYSIGLYSFTGIAIVIGYFGYLLYTLSVPRLEYEPLFWIAAALLVYFSGNCLLWLAITVVRDDRDVFFSIYRINGVLTLLMNIVFCYALYLRPRTNNISDPISTHTA